MKDRDGRADTRKLVYGMGAAGQRSIGHDVQPSRASRVVMKCRCTTLIGMLCCLLAACSAPANLPTSTADLVFLTRGDCVNTPLMRENVDAALRALGRPVEYQMVDLDTLPKTDVRTGYPTRHCSYQDRDVFGLPAPIRPTRN